MRREESGEGRAQSLRWAAPESLQMWLPGQSQTLLYGDPGIPAAGRCWVGARGAAHEFIGAPCTVATAGVTKPLSHELGNIPGQENQSS